MKILLRGLLLALGLALFGWFVHEAGLAAIIAALANLDWQAPAILAPYLLVYAADTLGWRFSFGGKSPQRISFATLLRIRWAGEAINNLVPSAYVGGEALKVYLLAKQGVPVPNGTASVVAGKTAQTAGQVVFLFLAALVSTRLMDSESPLRQAAKIVLPAALAGMAGLFWLQRIGLFSKALQLAVKLRIPLRSLETKMASMRMIDDRILQFYREDQKHFFFSVVLYFTGWLLGTLEVLVIAYLLGFPIGLERALVIEAFVSVSKVFGMAVPGALGFQESGILLLFRAAALPDALAIKYAILRRGREVVFALIGLCLLYAEELSLKGLGGRTSLPPEKTPDQSGEAESFPK